MTVRIITGDVFDKLAGLPDGSVNCVVTSPPYWGLRDYGGIEEQLGQEPTFDEHMAGLVRLFREVRRVLRDDGTVWLNYGDCFAATEEAGGAIKAKDKRLMPHRLAIALCDDGWWVRQDIVWFKENPTPESVRDRPTTAHEYVFLLAKSERYWYNSEAIKTPYKEASINRLMQPTFDSQTGGDKDSGTGNRSYRKALENTKRKLEARPPAGWAQSESYENQDPRYRKREGENNKQRGFNKLHDYLYNNPEKSGKADKQREQQEMGANIRSVWQIATHPYPEAHFATFPPALVEPCIKAGCPEGGVVLDPFGGSGTVGLVADRLQRDAVLIELNPGYVEMARKRIEGEAGLFGKVSVE